MYGDSRSRLHVWEEIIERFLTIQPDVTVGGRLAIVTAGPPGAGKSRTIDQLLHNAGISGGFRLVDPDVVKDLLLDRAVLDGIYEPLLRQRLADGRPIMPRELSGLVHEESVRVARQIRRRCMKLGENVVVDGTLSWAEMVPEHMHEIAQHGYDGLHVLTVEVPVDVARERALTRWWEARVEPGTLLGGRYVPRAVVSGCWDDEAGHSRCRANAVELHRRAQRQEGLVVTLQTVDDLEESGHTSGVVHTDESDGAHGLRSINGGM